MDLEGSCLKIMEQYGSRPVSRQIRLEIDLKREICEVIATGRILVSKEPSTDRPGLISKYRFI